MSKLNQEPAIAFAEVARPIKSSYTQHPSPAFDGKFMVCCQGMKLFIPEDLSRLIGFQDNLVSKCFLS